METFLKIIASIVSIIGLLFWPIIIIGGIFDLHEAGDWVQIIWILLLIVGMWYIEHIDRK